jgi:hypothetical protein
MIPYKLHLPIDPHVSKHCLFVTHETEACHDGQLSFLNKWHLKSPACSNYIYLTPVPFIAFTQCVPIATEPDISLIILPLMRILGALQTHTTDTFLFISHTTNVPLFKFRCNIFIGVRIIKEMPGSVPSGTHCTFVLLITELKM